MGPTDPFYLVVQWQLWGFGDSFSGDGGEGRPPRMVDLGLMMLLMVIRWLDVCPVEITGETTFWSGSIAVIRRCWQLTAVDLDFDL